PPRRGDGPVAVGATDVRGEAVLADVAFSLALRAAETDGDHGRNPPSGPGRSAAAGRGYAGGAGAAAAPACRRHSGWSSRSAHSSGEKRAVFRFRSYPSGSAGSL